MKHARKTNGLTSPFSIVTSGLVAAGAIIGTLLSVATCDSAMTLAVTAGPTSATTLSSEINLVAALTDSAASDFASASTILIFLPLMPPASLASLTASLSPLLAFAPYCAWLPVNSKFAPITISSPVTLLPPELPCSPPPPPQPVNNALAKIPHAIIDANLNFFFEKNNSTRPPKKFLTLKTLRKVYFKAVKTSRFF